MAIFKRRKSESVMPEEVQDFYAAERRQRKGTAWLLAIATLLVTFLLAALLFFGGRWVYRAIFDKKDAAPTSQSESKQQSGESTESTDQSAVDAPNNNRDASGSNSSSSGNTSAPATPSPTPSTTPTTAGSSASQPIPSTGPSELVNTGPGDE